MNGHRIKEEILNIKNLAEYVPKIEELVISSLKIIFGDKFVLVEKDNMAKTIYDLVIDLRDQKYFIEVKHDSLSLEYFWESDVNLISDHLKRKNDDKKRIKKLKYILILIDSRDSVDKLNLKPIKPNVLIINLTKIIDIRNYVIHQNRKELILELFKNCEGVLHDDFITNYLDFLNSREFMDSYAELKYLNYRKDILDFNYNSLLNSYRKKEEEFILCLEKLLKLEYNRQRHLSNDEIKYELKLNDEDVNYLIYLKNRIEPFSKNDEEKYNEYNLNIFRDDMIPSLYNLVYDYDFDYINAKKFSNYLIKEKKITSISDFPIKEKMCGIAIFLSPNNYFLKYDFKSHFKEKSYKIEFKTNFIDNITDLNDEILERNCVIIDISNIDNEISYFLGKNKNHKNIILISQYIIDNPILKRDFELSFFIIDKKNRFLNENAFSNKIKLICDKLFYS